MKANTRLYDISHQLASAFQSGDPTILLSTVASVHVQITHHLKEAGFKRADYWPSEGDGGGPDWIPTPLTPGFTAKVSADGTEAD